MIGLSKAPSAPKWSSSAKQNINVYFVFRDLVMVWKLGKQCSASVLENKLHVYESGAAEPKLNKDSILQGKGEMQNFDHWTALSFLAATIVHWNVPFTE